jgi:hypothetical protein
VKVDGKQRYSGWLSTDYTALCSRIYEGVLISLWLFLFPICSTTKRIFLGWGKEVRTTKSYVCGAQGWICRVNIFFQSRSLFFFLYKAKDLSAPFLELFISETVSTYRNVLFCRMTFRNKRTEVNSENLCFVLWLCIRGQCKSRQHCVFISGITYGGALLDYGRAVLRGAALFVMLCPWGQFGQCLIGRAHFVILYLLACIAPSLRLDHGGTGVSILPLPWRQEQYGPA